MEHNPTQKEQIMSIIGAVIMWVFAFIAFLIITRWPMGEEYDRRKAYWARFEGR
jgi:hypothetical protein